MKLFSWFFTLLIVLSWQIPALSQSNPNNSESYLNWSASQSQNIGKQMRVNGQVGNTFNIRIIHTDHAINYKLRATLMTPEVIRATARLHQLTNRLTDDQTRALVKEAEDAGDLIVMVEIDPREGSGVIPLDWRVFLQPKGLPRDFDGAISGIKSPQLKKIKALSGVSRRDYDYDVFFVSFSFVDENKAPLIPATTGQIELLVGIYGNEGKVSWTMPESIREKIRSLSIQD